MGVTLKSLRLASARLSLRRTPGGRMVAPTPQTPPRKWRGQRRGSSPSLHFPNTGLVGETRTSSTSSASICAGDAPWFCCRYYELNCCRHGERWPIIQPSSPPGVPDMSGEEGQGRFACYLQAQVPSDTISATTGDLNANNAQAMVQTV